MCRSTDYHGVLFNDSHQHRRLKIQSFSVRFLGLHATKPLPESLTLLYLPRIDDNDNTGLVVHGSKVRPHSRAFVSLYRERDGVVFASREPVRASDGVRFEVYFREEKVLKGIFRKDEDSDEIAWVLDCKCALESDVLGLKVSEAEVYVAVEGDVVITRRVSLKRKRCGRGFTGLEEIPEETEMDVELDSCDCDCSCGQSEIEFDGGDSKEGCDGDTELDMEGVRWAVDVGIWVMCLGVGFLVSKASAKTLRRTRLL